MAAHGIAIVSNNDIIFDCSWRILDSCRPPHKFKGTPFQTIDVVFEAKQGSIAPPIFEGSLQDAQAVLTGEKGSLMRMTSTAFEGGSTAFKFLLESLRAATFPSNQGDFIIRSDIVPLQFIDCEVVALASSFAEPLQVYSGEPVSRDQLHGLDEILKSSTAELLLRDRHLTGDMRTGLGAFSSLADAELENRLSFLWIADEPLRRLRSAIVDGSRPHPDQGGTGPNIYLAAKVLGIDMVMLDNPGHSLESGSYEHWREAFIPTKLVKGADPEFAGRIVASVKSYDKPIDGIITFWEQAYRIATDKYKTSIFPGHVAFRASSAEEAVRLAQEKMVEFLLIIKPCRGYSSDGVSRISSLSELSAAVSSINTERHGNELVVEKYCSGPEVDANFVLLDGEIIFFECCDDFLKTADNPNACNGSSPAASNFHELNSVSPSALPQKELDLIRDNFHEMFSRLGFESRIMHLESRVEHSSVDYRQGDGVLDLAPLPVINGNGTSTKSKEPAPWLIEINPRPPGMKVTQIIESTWGVDYWGLGMLFSLRDKPRVRALSQPYERGPQYTCVMVFISADYDTSCEGIFDSDDICTDLFARRPDLVKHVSRYGCLATKGQRIPHPHTGINTFMAYFNVFSRVSRREALELAAVVREEVRFVFR
ncbi:uncharacterized protein BCR38DRAFT_459952 [Pseudomassariella vexata]|uniref:ATP-grasp domain-containing protein n=1 Tax=Pseudomassariella vexata TaxID=1141098 RepID=A0A1Y2DKW3_9PEZI|nr:uncharacterized protein BCR38DRAFT_459952 [Pseudomassariella vexata]ORY59928.1 hypothetical protein BCR38DRAFT_459952 [Pseudomassariella vexata]